MPGRVLVVRLDSMGDMLAAGPAIRAVARDADRVSVLAGPLGRQAAQLLPEVDDIAVWPCPWISNPAPDVSRADIEDVIARVRQLRVDRAVILTSFHQSPLPTALVLRLAGVAWIAAGSEDYPGSLLDLRLPIPGDVAEPVRMLELVRSAGFELATGDDGRLRVRRPLPGVDTVLHLPARVPFVVVHPGANASARAYPTPLWAAAVGRLVREGWQVVLTGTTAEKHLTSGITEVTPPDAAGAVHDLAGTLTLPELAAVLDRAEVTVIANTGPAHLSAAVGTPVVSLFAPVVPAVRWAPFGVPVALLGDQESPCRGTRWVTCQLEGHPCLSGVTSTEIADAVRRLSSVEPSRTRS